MQKPKSTDNRRNSSPRSAEVLAPPQATAASDGAQVLNDIVAFIRRYLVCDDHQLTILTLWTACTQCHHHFSTAPYLYVRSPQPQSGKSLCLNLLCDLVNGIAPFTGVPAVSLLDRLIQSRSLDTLGTTAPAHPCLVFIDDCEHSFGPSERQPVVCALASGLEATGFFPWGDDDYCTFGPKALAGSSDLPRSLATRSIPIHLRRPKPTEQYVRYELGDVSKTLENLRDRLRRWLSQAAPALVQAANRLPSDLPPALPPGQSRTAEPLVHIADVAGGSWPAKVRAALVPIFHLAEANPELQMLSDIRSIFHDQNNPEYLATGDLLSQLHNLESRPWSTWTGKSGRRLATHLRPFGIMSRRLTLSSDEDFMAYLRSDFLDAWDRYLPQLRREGDGAEPLAFSNPLAGCGPLGKPEPIALGESGVPQEATRAYAIGAD